MIRGHGTLEIYNRLTGEVVRSCENDNIILDQGILGLMGDPTGTTWVAWNAWLIQVGTGYVNPPDASYVTGLDDPHPWTSSPTNTTYSLSGSTFTVQAEIEPTEANGNLIEACLISNKALNRLMFKSPALLPAGSYQYQVYNQIGSGAGALYSPASNTVLPPATVGTGALLLSWTQNYTGNVTRYQLLRKGPGDSAFRFLTSTTSTFFIDAGFVAPGAVSSFTPTMTIAAPSLGTPTFSNAPQPFAQSKTIDFAARVKITITLTI